MNSWKQTNWKSVCNLKYGKALKGYKHFEGLYPVYGSGGIVGSTDHPIAPAESPIVSRKGTLTAYWSDAASHVIDTAFWLEPEDELDSKWSYYAIKDLDIASLASGSGVPSLSRDDFHREPLLLPPISDQKAIAHILGTLDDKIELNRQMNETLEEIAKAIFKSWFVDFDPVRAKMEGRPTGLPDDIAALFPDRLVDCEIGEIPEGWEASKAGDLFECLDSRRVPLSGNERSQRPGNIPYYGATSVIDHVDDFIFDGTYLLLGEDGSVERKDGTAFSQYVSGKIWVNNHAHVLLGSKTTTTEFLYLAFQFIKISPYVTGAVQLKISQKNLRDIPLVSPPKELADIFQRIIEPIFQRRLVFKRETEVLADLRDTLLPKLVSGELQVPDAEKFLEEAGI